MRKIKKMIEQLLRMERNTLSDSKSKIQILELLLKMVEEENEI